MDTISLDRARAIKSLNNAFEHIAKRRFEEALKLFQRVLEMKKDAQNRGGILLTESDHQTLKGIVQDLFNLANRCANNRAYQDVIALVGVIQKLNEIIGGFVWTNIFYLQGVAYEELGDLKNARKAFAEGAFLDPECKIALERIRREMAQQR